MISLGLYDDMPELELIPDDDEGESSGDDDSGGRFVVGRVIPQLFLGSARAAGKDVLDKFGISHVLGVGERLPIGLADNSPIPRIKTPTAAADGKHYEYTYAGVQYMALEVEDSEQTSLMNHLPGCFQFLKSALKEQDSQVLILCSEGVSASVSVLASYLICEMKMRLAHIMGKIKGVNPQAEPNKGFARLLRFLERSGELPEWVMPV